MTQHCFAVFLPHIQQEVRRVASSLRIDGVLNPFSWLIPTETFIFSVNHRLSWDDVSFWGISPSPEPEVTLMWRTKEWPQLCNPPVNTINTTKDCGQQRYKNVNKTLMLTLKETILVSVSSRLDDSRTSVKHCQTGFSFCFLLIHYYRLDVAIFDVRLTQAGWLVLPSLQSILE